MKLRGRNCIRLSLNNDFVYIKLSLYIPMLLPDKLFHVPENGTKAHKTTYTRTMLTMTQWQRLYTAATANTLWFNLWEVGTIILWTHETKLSKRAEISTLGTLLITPVSHYSACHSSKKSLPLSSTTINAGKSCTSTFHIASIPITKACNKLQQLTKCCCYTA